MEEEKKNISVSTIVVTVVAIIFIIALTFLFYYYSQIGKSLPNFEPVVYEDNNVNVKEPEPPPAESTSIIVFEVPDVLPTLTKQGKCVRSSIALPFREDAFRCMIGNLIYDPCFTVPQNGFVYCQVGVDSSTGFLMKLTQALPKVSIPEEKLANWAWFVKLKDGTYCSPFTGTRPIAQDRTAYYGCKSDVKNEQIVLMGGLITGDVWTAEKAVLVKNGTSLTIKSLEQANIDIVWQ